MSYAYAQRKKADAKTPAAQNTPPERLNALQSGAVKPSAAEMGHRVDLPEAMRAKMESSFGADLSAVKLYESQSVADAGAEAIAQGSSIAFAPGKLDLTSSGGQALLGHELSHVVSQARGEVTGGGFLNDHALEARADREGAMAARGESVYGGMSYGGAVAPLSSASAAPAAGPMQAKRMSAEEKAQKKKMDVANTEATALFRIASADMHNMCKGIHKNAPGYLKKTAAEDEYDDSNIKLSPELMQVLIDRKFAAASRLNEQYQQIKPGEDAEKQKMRLGLGKDALDFQTYSGILNQRFGTQGVQIVDELTKRTQENPELEAAHRVAQDLTDGYKKNKYYQTDEGKAEYERGVQAQGDMAKQNYNKGKFLRQLWLKFG